MNPKTLLKSIENYCLKDPEIGIDISEYLINDLDLTPKFNKITDINVKNLDIEKLQKAKEVEPIQNAQLQQSKAPTEEPQSRSSSPTLISNITDEEYRTIPKYMARNLSLSDLNLTIISLKNAILNRLKLRKANFNELSKRDKDKVIQIRTEQKALKLDKTSMYCSESEFKECLDMKLKVKMKWSVQMLRHTKRIRELIHRRESFYVLI